MIRTNISGSLTNLSWYYFMPASALAVLSNERRDSFNCCMSGLKELDLFNNFHKLVTRTSGTILRQGLEKFKRSTDGIIIITISL